MSGRSAREEISDLLKSMGINMIVWVDDQFVVNADRIEELVETLILSKAEAAATCEECFPGITFDDYGDWKPLLRVRWNSENEGERNKAYQQLSEMLGVDAGKLEQAWFPNPIQRMCEGSGVKVYSFPPSRWLAAKSQIQVHLGENPASHALCLFDLVLENDKNAPASDGIGLIQQCAVDFTCGRVLCGLLSQQFHKDEELTEGRKLANEQNVPAGQFLPLSKDRLASEIDFAEGLRLASLMMACSRLIREVAQTAQKATEYAQEQVEDITVFDFSRLVINTSITEGIWEVETLVRLFNLYQGAEMRRIIYENRPSLNLWTKHVHDHAPKAEDVLEAQKGIPWKHSQMDYYDRSEALNHFHLPIDLGDIFQAGNSYYVLLGQQCELAVRAKGTRGAKYGTLVEISMKSPEENQKHVTAELPYFGPTDGAGAYVYFKKSFPVYLDILDLAAFDTDGQCKFSLTQECPAALHGASQQRFARLKKDYQKKAGYLDSMATVLTEIGDSTKREELWAALLPHLDLPGAVPNYKGGVFSFTLQRVARYRSPRVGALLQQWAASLARPAFDPTLAVD